MNGMPLEAYLIVADACWSVIVHVAQLKGTQRVSWQLARM